MSQGGIPLVFIHAFPLSARMWDVNKPALERNFRFIAVDLPGFGQVPLPKDPPTMESMANHVLKSLDEMKIQEKFIVAGLSMGGYVMLQLLKKAPDRVRAAAFLSTRASADTPEGRERRFKNNEFIEKNGAAAFADRMVQTLVGKTTLSSNPKLIEQIKAWISASDVKAICAAQRAMAERPDMGALLDSLDIPALFLAGEEDVVIPAAEMEAMSKRVKRGRFRMIPHAGHLINLEKPDQFNAEFLNFLKASVL